MSSDSREVVRKWNSQNPSKGNGIKGVKEQIRELKERAQNLMERSINGYGAQKGINH